MFTLELRITLCVGGWVFVSLCWLYLHIVVCGRICNFSVWVDTCTAWQILNCRLNIFVVMCCGNLETVGDLVQYKKKFVCSDDFN